MSLTIDRLKADHRRLRNVLGALKRKGDDLPASHTLNDTDHLFCLLDYVTNYPDHVHHPLEDKVFDELTAASLTEEEAADVEANRRQHDDLLAATKKLLGRIDALDKGRDIDVFVEELQLYLSRQLEHMQFEEERVFPIASARLSQAAWDRLDAQFGTTDDPLFDRVEAQYQGIYPFLDADPDEKSPVSSGEPLYRFLGATGLRRLGT